MALTALFTDDVEKRFSSTLSVTGAGAWWPLVNEPFAGAWQRNEEIHQDTVLAYSAVFACITLIASDIAKMRLKLVKYNSSDGIWNEVDANSPFWPVLRKPNRYQTRIKFVEQWQVSKLIHGNTYALKVRDARGIVTGLYILNPFRVQVLVSEDGGVYYQLSQDELNGQREASITVPASEIIHDTMVSLWHPLVGVSPLYACGLAAMQGFRIQQSSSKFFKNAAMPSGILSAPGTLDAAKARALSQQWNDAYGGDKSGRVAVLGDGLKFEPMTMTAVDAQMIETLKWTAEDVARAFRVPGYKIGVGQMPAYNNIAALDQQYYSQCLQIMVESMELCLDEGLGLTKVEGQTLGVEFDLDDLIRMDPAAQTDNIEKGIKAGALSPNEGRRKLGYGPVKGGESPYLQQQNYSLGALADRDATNPLAAPPPAPPPPPEPEADPGEMAMAFLTAIKKGLIADAA
jgi:HK97 family phage portal protein